MSATIAYIIDSVLNSLSICCWVIFLGREFIYPLNQEIEYLKNTQDMLYRSIQTLKTIVDIDKEYKTVLFNQVKDIKAELDTLRITFETRINKIEKELSECKSEENKDSDEENKDSEEENKDSEEENKDSEEENKDSEEEEDICPNIEVLPIQNHITFPQFIIFNDDNYKVSRTKSRDRELKNDTRILSEQVDKFLDKKIGTCMTFDETYELIWQYIGLHCNIGTQCHLKGFTKYIELDPNLRQLFGITEYEDYELTTETLPKYLEPHLKHLINV